MISINISDLHFGKFNPKIQFDILMEQCYSKIKDIQFDFFVISGDLFDHKMYSENEAIMYATIFVENVHTLCKSKGAKLILLKGTQSHDSDQLRLFYHTLQNNMDSFAIVEHIGFVEHKGYRILCIPEEHGLPVEEYENALFNNGFYDMAVFHGLLKNSCYGTEIPTINTQGPPIFDISHFYMCRGPIIGGHIHVSNCLQRHMYYTGSPYRWCFGEEQAKGFIVMCMNDYTRQYLVHFQEIESFSYNTVNLDGYLDGTKDPKFLIEHIKSLMESGIDYIRVEFTRNSDIIPIIKDYFKNNSHVHFKTDDIAYYAAVQEVQQSNDKFKEHDYLLDNSLTPEDKLARYINQKEGLVIGSEMYLTGKDILEILSDYEVTKPSTI